MSGIRLPGKPVAGSYGLISVSVNDGLLCGMVACHLARQTLADSRTACPEPPCISSPRACHEQGSFTNALSAARLL